jgi:hypothetical protein
MVISSDQRVCRESNYVARCRTLRAVGECSYLGGSIRGRGSRCSRTRSLRSVSARDGIAEGRRRQTRWSPNRKCFNNRAAPPPPAAARVSIQLNTRGVRLQPCRQATIGHVGDGESTCSDAPRSSSFASAIFAKPRRCCRRCRQASASVPRRPRFARSSVLPAVVPRSKCAACVFARNARTRSLPRTCGESTCCGRIAAPLSLIEAARGVDLHLPGVRLVLRSGEPERVVRALATLACSTAIRGTRHENSAMRMLVPASELSAARPHGWRWRKASVRRYGGHELRDGPLQQRAPDRPAGRIAFHLSAAVPIWRMPSASALKSLLPATSRWFE